MPTTAREHTPVENGGPNDTLDTEEANARLIAAAPELVAFIEKYVADHTPFEGDPLGERKRTLDQATALLAALGKE